MATEPIDSGMASLDDSSKDVTPEKPNKTILTPEEDKTIANPEGSKQKAISAADDSDDEDIEDESFAERLVGLTEMFPEPVVNFTSAVGRFTKNSIKGLYNFSRSALWIAASSSLILFGPLVFEVERAQLEESQRSQQKQFLLGPNSMSGSLSPNMALTSPR